MEKNLAQYPSPDLKKLFHFIEVFFDSFVRIVKKEIRFQKGDICLQ